MNSKNSLRDPAPFPRRACHRDLTRPWSVYVPIAHLDMDFVVAAPAQAHEVRPVMSPAFADGQDVMDLVHQDSTAFFEATFAQRMLLRVAVPDPLPNASVLPVHVGRTFVSVVLPAGQVFVLIAVLSVGQVRAPGIGTRTLRLARHIDFLH